MKKLLVAGIAVTALWGAPTLAAPPSAPMFDWTGFYIGANAGYGWGDMQSSYVAGFLVFGPTSLSATDHGFFGGGQLGYNWQNGRIVFGLETDISGSAIQGTASGVNGARTTTTNEKIPWFGTARGRIGFLPDDKLLIFASGGFAFGETKESTTVINSGGCAIFSCVFGNASGVSSGLAAGGGFEYAYSPLITIKGEYLLIDLGGRTANYPITIVQTS